MMAITATIEPNSIEMNVSPVFKANYDAYFNPNNKIMTNQGGTRSGKTYSIMQLLVVIAMTNDVVISIVSKTLPHIKRGVFRDFMDIMDHPQKGLGIFDENKLNKTELIYKFEKNSFIEFFSADNAQKLRGPGRDILFINEANLLTLEEWRQLLYRTRQKVFIDYNPVDEYCWIYDHVITREDCKFIQSSYLDNYDYLEKTQIEEIERLKEIDPQQWEIFGLGNVAKATNLIYNNFTIENKKWGNEAIYGLDFGYNNPTSLVKVQYNDGELLVTEELYETKLTNSDLLEKLKEIIKNKNSYIYADAAEPARIQEIKTAGFNVWAADKSVKTGIDFCKRFKLFVNPQSVEIIKEIKAYKWKQTRDEKVLDEPVKFNDHAMDAMRYAIFSHGQKYWNTSTASIPNMHLINKKRNKVNKYSTF